MWHILSVLPEISLSTVYPCLYIYAMNCVTSIHAISLTISRLRKDCVLNLLGGDSLKTESVGTSHGALRSFRKIRKMGLRCLKLYLKHAKTNSPGSKLNLDFSNNGLCSRFTRLFSTSGLVGMLKAFEFDTIYRVFFFQVSLTCFQNENHL